MQIARLRKPDPLLVSPVEMRAATLPYPGDCEKIEQRRASIATNLRNVGYAAMVMTAGLSMARMNDYAHGPYGTIAAAVTIAGTARLAQTYMRAATITSELIASGHAETFGQMVVMPGDLPPTVPNLPPNGPQLPPTPPSAG